MIDEISTIKVYVVDAPMDMSKKIYVVKHDLDKRYILHGDAWKKITPGVEPVPTMNIRDNLVQMMVDELTKQIKPSLESEVVGELRATKLHLEDFRALVFKSKKRK